ncbi:hypothetical protein TYRP_006395 [Tyrophagus putrescentiae]|nr:hypothetical protein TYRP_006395 [Tyrophagus putrescentiae]
MGKDDCLSVELRKGFHQMGETGKSGVNGGHRLGGEWYGTQVMVIPWQLLAKGGGRSGFLFFVFLLRRVAAIDAVKGPNDGDEGANKAKRSSSSSSNGRFCPPETSSSMSGTKGEVSYRWQRLNLLGTLIFSALRHLKVFAHCQQENRSQLQQAIPWPSALIIVEIYFLSFLADFCSVHRLVAQELLNQTAVADRGATTSIGKVVQVQVFWIVEQRHQRQGHLHRVVLHLSRCGGVKAQPVPLQLRPRFVRGTGAEFSVILPRQQAKVLEEGEQLTAKLHLLFFSVFSGAAVFQLKEKGRKDHSVYVGQWVGIHLLGQEGKRALHGGHRFWAPSGTSKSSPAISRKMALSFSRRLKFCTVHRLVAHKLIHQMARADGPGTAPMRQPHQVVSQVQWVIEKGHQHRGHLHRMVLLHLQMFLKMGAVVGQPVLIQVLPLYFKWTTECSEVSMVPFGQQVEVLEESEQIAAGFRQVLLLFFFFTVFSGGAVGQLTEKGRKEHGVYVCLRVGVHFLGQKGKGAYHGGQRFRDGSSTQVLVIPWHLLGIKNGIRRSRFQLVIIPKELCIIIIILARQVGKRKPIRGHLNRVILHHRLLSLRVGVVEGQPVSLQLEPSIIRANGPGVLVVPLGQQAEVLEEDEQVGAVLLLLLLAIFSAGGAVGQLAVKVRKEHGVYVCLRMGVHLLGQAGKGVLDRGHRFRRELTIVQVSVVPL